MKIWFRLFLLYLDSVLIVLLAISCKHPAGGTTTPDHRYRDRGIALADSILSLSPERQTLGFIKSYSFNISNKDSAQAITILDAAEQAFKERNKTILRRQAWLLKFAYQAEKKSVGEAGAVIMLQAAEKAAARNWPITEAECWHYAGSYYFKGNLFVPAFEYLRKAQNVFDRNDSGENEYLLRYAGGLALCYFQFGEYGEAINYMKKELRLPQFWTEFYYSPDIHNTVGLCYQQLRKYDSAAIWFNQSYELASSYKDSFYMALANGNLGYTYYLQGQYDRALPLMEADYVASTKAGETGSAINSASTIADIFIKKGQLADAEKYMGLTKEFVLSIRTIPLLKYWYENLFNLSRAKGDLKSINLYTDSMLLYKDSLARMRDKKIFNQEVLKLEMEKHLNEVNQLESRRWHQVLLRNSLLVGLVLIAIIALLWVNRQLLKRNKERELARQELEFANQELLGYMHQLKEKNELVEQLREELSGENDTAERTGMINHLLSATILTEEDWKRFRELFEKVYPGFFIRLREKIPDLSPTETRLFALTKLQMPLKDMAAMLGVSYDAIRKARQRVRKKINLPEEGDLEELVNII
jgi:tetratricopeptide (TPR) repeat protein